MRAQPPPKEAIDFRTILTNINPDPQNTSCRCHHLRPSCPHLILVGCSFSPVKAQPAARYLNQPGPLGN